MPEVKPAEIESSASIKVVGVGGAGGSAINRMRDAGLSGVELIAMNTDAQALHNSKADRKVHLGHDVTHGLGAGAEPSIGEKAADETRDDIKEALEGADMVFITLGAGGGTGSGAGYIVAEEARKLGILTVGVVTKPFTFEGQKRKQNADWALERLVRNVDALITIPNDRLLQTIDPKTPLTEAFKIADSVLHQGVQGIADLITEHALINLDFADVKAIMKDAGSALMGIGRASGENRAAVAAQAAIESPLIEVSIDGARGVLFSVAGGYDVTMAEMQEAAEVITASVSPDANVIWGASIRPELEDEVVVTVVATGFDSEHYREKAQALDEEAAAVPATTDFEGEAREKVDVTGMAKNKDVVESDDEPPVGAYTVDANAVKGEMGTAGDFTDATTVNMWEVIRPETITSGSIDDGDRDIPAILRRRKRKKD